MDLCDLSQGYFSTAVDEVTGFACLSVLLRKSDGVAETRWQVAWCKAQTDCRVQQVRDDWGGR
jgi:hypothetical protein